MFNLKINYMKKIYLSMILAGILSANNTNAQNLLSENFDDIPGLLSTGGWTQDNNSVPLGLEIWHQGVGVGLPAYNGHDSSFAEASFMSTDDIGVGNISNWLISPQISLSNGDVVSFFTTSFNNLNFPDRLDLRLNILNTTNVGTTDTSVGDFNVLLLQLNPNLMMDSTLYPQGYWAQFTSTISGLQSATNCRIAFRYNVTNGGGSGLNSSTIGIDAFSVDRTVGILETPSEFELSVYPNPVHDNLTVAFAKPLDENGKLRIYNSLGQIVSNFNVLKGQTKASFNSSFLANGAYSIVVELPGSITKKGFLKN